MDAETRRRYVILAEGQFGEPGSKTAMGVIKYGRDDVVSVIDSTRAGHDVSEWLGPEHAAPVVAMLAEALETRPTALLIGTAPQGGRIPPAWPTPSVECEACSVLLPRTRATLASGTCAAG